LATVSNSIKRLLLIGLILLPALGRVPISRAQAGGPVYIVQEGDSYWGIADTFKVTIPDLLAANGFSVNHILNPGDRLIIPGYAGIQGILSTRTVELGDTLSTLSLRTGIPVDTLLRLNRLVNPERLFAGQVMIVVEPEDGLGGVTRWETGRARSLSAGTPLLALAAEEGKNPWELTGLNNLSSQADQFSGQSLLTVGGEQTLRAWPAPVENIQFRSLPLVQGTTTEVTLGVPQDAQAEGTLGGLSLIFRPWNNSLAALQGIYARAKPGTVPLIVLVTMPDGRSITFQQDVLLEIGDYIIEKTDLNVPPATIDLATIQTESDEMKSLVATFTEERYWEGLFKPPVANPRLTSVFGNWRTYNGNSYGTFHTGVDYYAQDKTEILAPAPGRVVFAEERVICGNATVIDHGWGVYTRYCHQSKFMVQVGEMVKTGQVIGLVGHTGRSDGPHLHWEIWVGGVQVNPLIWLEEVFP
jgi:murein DD-endopeptidase MepM/ murein hydrolase activator NlpD